jgi:hypothetical protein
VPGKIKEELQYTDFAVEKKIKSNKEEYILVKQVVENTGNVSSFAIFNMEMKNAFTGAVVYEAKNSKFLVQRGTTFDNNHEIHEYPFFGKFDVVSEVSMETRDGEIVPVATKNDSLWIIPWLEIMLTLGTLVIVIALIIWRIKKYSGKGWVEYEVQKGENIQTIADDHPGYSWKTIAKVNKLKSPYLLQAGQVILVPPTDKPKKEDA